MHFKFKLHPNFHSFFNNKPYKMNKQLCKTINSIFSVDGTLCSLFPDHVSEHIICLSFV